LLVEEDSKDFNLTLMGFPEWCPLDTMESSKMIDYKKEVKQIMQIMQIMPDDFSQDELLEASHYLNRVIETAKKAKAG
jgi:hypothetical protein